MEFFPTDKLVLKGHAGAYSEPCQQAKMGHFAKIVNSYKPLSITIKRSFLDVWQGYEYTSFINALLYIDHTQMFLTNHSAAEDWYFDQFFGSFFQVLFA